MDSLQRMALTVLTLAFSFPLDAEENAAGADPQVYLEQLQTRLEHTARRANQPSSGSSSVIGLRGSRQEPLSKQLYWKGQKTSDPVNLDEVKDFRAAIEKAREGKTDEALAALKVFQIKYPASPMRTDVDETIRVLNTPAPAVTIPPPDTKAS